MGESLPCWESQCDMRGHYSWESGIGRRSLGHYTMGHHRGVFVSFLEILHCHVFLSYFHPVCKTEIAVSLSAGLWAADRWRHFPADHCVATVDYCTSVQCESCHRRQYLHSCQGLQFVRLVSCHEGNAETSHVSLLGSI